MEMKSIKKKRGNKCWLSWKGKFLRWARIGGAQAPTQTGRERAAVFTTSKVLCRRDVRGTTRCVVSVCGRRRTWWKCVSWNAVGVNREIFASSSSTIATDTIIRVCPASIDSVLPSLTWRYSISTSRFNLPTSRANRPSYPCPAISNIKWDGYASSPERLCSVVFGLVQRRQAKRKRMQRPVPQWLTSSEAFKRPHSPVTCRIRCLPAPFQPVMSSLAILGPRLVVNR